MTGRQHEGYEFIIAKPNNTLSNESRTKIRRQAMKAVSAARRKVSMYTDQSLGRTNRYLAWWNSPHPPPPMPLSGLELLVKDSGLDPLDLSALTSVHIGPIASKILLVNPDQLPGILSCRQQSYFSFIPTRFGHDMALDDTYRCLITKVHSILVPAYKPNDQIVISYYLKALNSTQSAISNSKTQYSAETLCAVGNLALFELLNSPNELSWHHHIAGTSRLTKMRGPARFASEFDKALLIALAYPICSEALFNNEKCFLEDPIWTKVFEAAINPHENFTDRSELGITLIILMAKIPGLAKKTSHAVVVQDSIQPEDFKPIAASVRIVRSSIITWRCKFNHTLINTEGLTSNDTADFGKRYELLGISLIINIIASRMLCFISPYERALLEEEVQNLATELKAIEQSTEHNQRASFFLAQKARIADAAIDTHAIFIDVLASGNIVEPWRLKRFCELLGRKCCDGETCCE